MDVGDVRWQSKYTPQMNHYSASNGGKVGALARTLCGHLSPYGVYGHGNDSMFAWHTVSSPSSVLAGGLSGATSVHQCGARIPYAARLTTLTYAPKGGGGWGWGR